jgi:membrane-associated PAP2 superfamily phosphatase
LAREGATVLLTMLAFALLEVVGDLVIGEPLHVEPAWVLLVALASLPWLGTQLGWLSPHTALRVPHRAVTPWWQSPWALLLGVVVLLAWDASGADLVLARLAGGPHGFPWRDTWFEATVLHEGLRWLAWTGTGWIALSLAWPTGVLRSLTRGERLWLLATMLTSTLLVGGMKHWSLTSCPWDLAEFGGVAEHVSHWHWGLADGGPGHCFPAGHASGGFAFVAGAFALWRSRPRAAQAWFAAAIGLGLAMGLGQQWRGAHFMSHTLWSAWLCWACAQAGAAAFLRHNSRP